MLFRTPLMAPDQPDKHLEEDVKAYVNVVFQDIPRINPKLEEIRRAQENYPLCQEVTQCCREGWPEK